MHTHIHIYSQFNVRVDLDMCSYFFIFCWHWISSSFCLLELCYKLHRILLWNARVETNGYGALRLPKCWFNPMIFDHFPGGKNPDIAWCNRNPGCIPKVITILILSPSNPQYCWWYYDIFWYILINVISRGVTIISTIMLGVDVGSMQLFRIENLTPVSLGMSSVCTSLMSSSSPSSPLAYFLKASGDSIQASGAFRSCSVRHMFCQNVKIGEQWWLNYSN